MKTATDILQERISSYNETVSDFSKIRFTSKELGIFTGGMEEYASQFHPSPKEISEEEIEPVIMEAIKLYQRDRSGITGLYPGRYNDFCQYLQIWIKERLSLPSSGSKTEEEFAEWTSKKGWMFNYIHKDWCCPSEGLANKKTSELKELFLKDKLTNKQGTIL